MGSHRLERISSVAAAPRATKGRAPLAVGLALLTLLGGVACQTAYYNALEQFGYEKRHILADRVENGRDDQREAQEQIQTTYERFMEVTRIDGGEANDLEKTYSRLNKDFERSESRAAAVSKRIASIENVADDLFAEWEREIEHYASDSLRRTSKQQLASMRLRYWEMIAAMRRVETSMDPVLSAFRDRVMFLKHNLNAQALAQLDGSVGEIRSDVDALLADMHASIQEADRFLASLES